MPLSITICATVARRIREALSLGFSGAFCDNQEGRIPGKFNFQRLTLNVQRESGGVAEWSIAPVLKTGVTQVTEGSNPSPSAWMWR